MFNAMPNPFMVLDEDRRILFANRSMIELAGLPGKDVVGKYCYEILHKAHAPVTGCLMDAVTAPGQTQPVETEIRTGTKTYLISCTRVPGATGAPTRFIHIGTDITEQKQEEQAAKELAQRYRLISEQLPCSIWSTDKDLRYTSSTGAGLSSVGLKPGQLIGKTICEFYGGQPEKERALEAYRHVLTGEPRTFESRYRGRQFLASIEPFRDENNRIIGTVGVAYDITAQKQMQYVLEQINRKHTLLNSITRHDAANKISALMAYLQLLKDEAPGPEARVYVEKMTQIVDQLAELIEFTQAYQSLGLKNPQWQNVSTLITALPAGPVQIVNDTGDALRFFADPMLEHVFVNLLDNSVRHGEHVTTITVSEQETKAGLVLTWEDNGIGVPAEDKERIFERGFGKHTGLGLFLIREILSITGITIRETGIPGKGARFEILVPTGAYGFLSDP
jgi:PAS domain S-box-containing protein